MVARRREAKSWTVETRTPQLLGRGVVNRKAKYFMQKPIYIERVLPSIRRCARRRPWDYGEKAPVVLCRGDDIHLSFWCPFCQKFHLHGSGGGKIEESLGDRAAHCFVTSSPFNETGYILALDREWRATDRNYLAREHDRLEALRRKLVEGAR